MFLDRYLLSWFTENMARGGTVFRLFLFVLISWSIYRYISHFPAFVDDFIAKPLLWLPAVYIVVRIYEKKSLETIGISLKRVRKNVLIGFIGSFVLTGELLLSVGLRNNFHFQLRQITVSLIGITFFSSLATGVVEEIVFRGYIQSRLMKLYKGVVMPIGLSALFFVIVHLPIMIFVLHYSFSQIISYSVLVGILGVIDGYLFMRTKTLIASVIVHTLWNFMSVLVH